MDPNRRRLLREAAYASIPPALFVSAPPPFAAVPAAAFGAPLGGAPLAPPPVDLTSDRYQTWVLQGLTDRPELNGQVVRIHDGSWDDYTQTYRVRAGGDTFRVAPANLRPATEADMRRRLQDRGQHPTDT